MAVIYIAEQGASLHKKGERIYVYKEKKLIKWFHTKDAEQLVLIGNVNLVAPTITYLLKENIDTVFMSVRGDYKGRLVGEMPKNVELRSEQFKYLEAVDNRLCLAQRYVYGKFSNSLAHLKKRKKRMNNKSLTAIIKNLNKLLTNFNDNILSLEILRGYEGIFAKNYFSAFPYLITNNDFYFSGRNRRPPKDEVNVLLSLSYTFLMNQVISKANIVGLDPYFGALHDVDYGRQSLVLDIMEEFRPLIDNMILTLINKHELKKHHFTFNEVDIDNDEETSSQPLPVILNHDGIRILILSFTALMNTKFKLSDQNAEWALKDIILLQLRKLVAHFTGKSEYSPFLWA